MVNHNNIINKTVMYNEHVKYHLSYILSFSFSLTAAVVFRLVIYRAVYNKRSEVRKMK